MKRKNILGLLLIVSIVVVSCQKEEDFPTPTTSDRDKFLGTWSVSAYGSESKNQFWDMTISASNSSPDQILIKDFDLQKGTTTYASVSGSNFVISQQVISGNTISGSGSYAGGKLTFTYISDDLQKIDSVSATAKKS